MNFTDSNYTLNLIILMYDKFVEVLEIKFSIFQDWKIEKITVSFIEKSNCTSIFDENPLRFRDAFCWNSTRNNGNASFLVK